MSSAKLTLIGMNTYFQNAGSDLFEFLNLPTGLTKKTLTDNILLQGGEFEVLYSDPMSLKTSIGIWSDREAATFQRWVDALAIEYAPLENYDRIEAWTDTLDSDGTSNTTGTNDTRTTGTSDTTTTTNEDIVGQSTVQTDVSAYDSSGYQPKEKVTTNSRTDDDITQVVDNDTTEVIDNDTTEVIDNDTTTRNISTLDNTADHRGRVHGNIGVTTSQQMLQQELDLGYWNIYSRITDMFLKEFCIMIYV